MIEYSIGQISKFEIGYLWQIEQSDHWKDSRTDETDNQTRQSHDDSHNGIGLQHFRLGHSTHFTNHPEPRIIHPTDWF